MASDMHAPALWQQTSFSLSVSACKCVQQACVSALRHRLQPCRVLSQLSCIFSGLRVPGYSDDLYLHFTFCADTPLSEVTASSVPKLKSCEHEETAVLMLPVCPFVCLCVCVSACLICRDSLYITTGPSVCRSVCLSVCLAVCASYTVLNAWVHLCRYIFLVGMLMSQFTITGFDACAHMSEETVGADKSAPMAIVMAISVSAIAGFAYILAITFSIQVNTTLLVCYLQLW